MSEEPGFLSRWSRRKQGLARGEAQAEPPEAASAAPPEAPSEMPSEMPSGAPSEAPRAAPEAVFDPATLPDLATLDAASDFTVFLKPGVPVALRNAALRKAWLLDPLIRDHVSPLDYAWDFNTPGGLPHGFAAELGEAAEVVREMLARVVGLTSDKEEEPAALAAEAVVPAELPALPGIEQIAQGADRPLPEAESEPAGDDPAAAVVAHGETAPAVALEAAALEVAAIEVMAPGEPIAPPARRHGGAVPA